MSNLILGTSKAIGDETNDVTGDLNKDDDFIKRAYRRAFNRMEAQGVRVKRTTKPGRNSKTEATELRTTRTGKRKQVVPFQVSHDSKRARTGQTVFPLAVPNPVFPSFKNSKSQYERIVEGDPTDQDLDAFQQFIDSWYCNQS